MLINQVRIFNINYTFIISNNTFYYPSSYDRNCLLRFSAFDLFIQKLMDLYNFYKSDLEAENIIAITSWLTTHRDWGGGLGDSRALPLHDKTLLNSLNRIFAKAFPFHLLGCLLNMHWQTKNKSCILQTPCEIGVEKRNPSSIDSFEQDLISYIQFSYCAVVYKIVDHLFPKLYFPLQ